MIALLPLLSTCPMLILLSPAKTLDFDTPAHVSLATQPQFLKEAEPLITLLREKSPAEISRLMDLSERLAALNVTRYAEWAQAHAVPVAKQAVLAFAGDVYDGLGATGLPAQFLQGYVQQQVAILSGLYGLLRPLDLIRPYRLEMGTRLANAAGRDLYAYWGGRIGAALDQRLDALQAAGQQRVIVNLASEEYFRATRAVRLRARVIQPVFQDWKSGQYKIISFNAKRARGAMTRFAAEHSIVDPEALKSFDRDGYAFDDSASTADTWVFRRRAA